MGREQSGLPSVMKTYTSGVFSTHPEYAGYPYISIGGFMRATTIVLPKRCVIEDEIESRGLVIDNWRSIAVAVLGEERLYSDTSDPS